MSLNLITAALAMLVAVPGEPAPDMAAARSKLEALAKAGNAEAIYHLGMFYQAGIGVPADPARALALFQRAAAAGDPLGAYKVGCFYAGQYDVIPQDEAQALKFKLIAANAGYALAQQDVAAIYGRRGDYTTAKAWLGKAAAQGTTDALMTYASIHNGAPGIPLDLAIVAAYFRLALDRSDPSEKQLSWLRNFEAKLTSIERAKADSIRNMYRPKPTALTVKALSGQAAAAALIARE